MALFKIVWDNEHGFAAGTNRELTSFKQFDWKGLDEAGREDLLSRAEEAMTEAGFESAAEMDETAGELVVEVFDEFDFVRAIQVLPSLEALLDDLLPPAPPPPVVDPKEVVRASSVHSDFFKTPLFIGDEVAVIQPQYRNLVNAKVIAFTPKKVRVEWSQGRYKSVFLADPHCLVRKP